eukprot:6093979-Pleurochrysis_carterae.AAC.3
MSFGLLTNRTIDITANRQNALNMTAEFAALRAASTLRQSTRYFEESVKFYAPPEVRELSAALYASCQGGSVQLCPLFVRRLKPEEREDGRAEEGGGRCCVTADMASVAKPRKQNRLTSQACSLVKLLAYCEHEQMLQFCPAYVSQHGAVCLPGRGCPNLGTVGSVRKGLSALSLLPREVLQLHLSVHDQDTAAILLEGRLTPVRTQRSGSRASLRTFSQRFAGSIGCRMAQVECAF